MGTIGIPTKLLHEALGHVVTLELKGGQSYRGKLFDAEDNLNCSLSQVVLTARDGKQTHLDSVYIRGSMIRFIVVPDMLQQAPMFKRVGPNAMKGRGIGAARGRATIMRGKFGLWLRIHREFADQNSFACSAQSRRGRGGPGRGIRR